MSENTTSDHPEQPSAAPEATASPPAHHHPSAHIRGNRLFLVVLALLVLVPPSIVFFGPPNIIGLPDWTWIGVTWAVALILGLVADETAVRGEANLSSGFTQPGHVSHGLFRHPAFLAALAALVLAPTLIAFYLPPLLKGTPDWLWLGVAWVVAVAASWLAWTALMRVESKADQRPG